MLAKLTSYALVGIDALPVEVEVDTAHGLPKTILVGLPEMSVKESIHRIERALANLGYQRPSGRTIINLAPADLRKDAGGFDLPNANEREAAMIEGIHVYSVSTLGEAVGLLAGQITQEPIKAQIEALFQRLNTYDIDFADMRGHENAKWALVVASAGSHNVLAL